MVTALLLAVATANVGGKVQAGLGIKVSFKGFIAMIAVGANVTAGRARIRLKDVAVHFGHWGLGIRALVH